jgi:CRP-like cAMP-binding protein
MRTVDFPVGRRMVRIQINKIQGRRDIAIPADASCQCAGFSAHDSGRGQCERGRPAAVNFWETLTAAQRAGFRSAANERTFAAGAMLMREGEQADHVVVILRGRVKICVQERGREYVIAKRGPGQLVGERAALRVALRSATVIACDMVHALVMTTEDFAAFVTVNQGVLDIVESQIYDRLTEALPSCEPEPHRRLNGENCTVLLTDVVGFGAHARSDSDRRLIRKATLTMTQAVLGSFWDECLCGDCGDGLLVIAPPHIITTAVVECLGRLPYELERHNRTYSDALKIQIRTAVDVGPVVSDEIGLTGNAIIRAARLLDAREFKQSIGEAGASLGVIASNFVYDNAISQSNDPFGAASYRQIRLKVKETSTTAWMRLAGEAA